MSDETRKGTSWRAIVLALLMLASLYVLSAGPATFFVTRTGMGMKATQAMYAPLIWLHYTPLRKPVARYLELWE